MRNNGLDPEKYPVGGDVSDYHLASAPMGFGNITHAEGYLDSLKGGYDYQPSPECSARDRDCGSKYLWCDVTASRCVPVDPLNRPDPGPGPGPHPNPNPNPNPNPRPQPCPGPKPLANQNSFCVDGVCDVSRWVWVPVKIVAQRPPEFHDYQSYPVNNGKVSKANDIYEPSAYSDTNR